MGKYQLVSSPLLKTRKAKVDQAGLDLGDVLCNRKHRRVRNLREHGFEEGVSTRLLVYAGQLIVGGIDPRRACDVAVARAVTDDAEVQRAVADIVDVLLP